MKLKLYEAKIKGKAYCSMSVMAESEEEAIADIMKSENCTREDIISIEEK